MKRLADWASRPRDITEWAQIVVTAVVLAACTLFVFIALHPSKLFLNTLTAGGDMGAHVWAPMYLKTHLLPHGRISGWAPDWYDGFPALTFYFPGPYFVIALLSYVIPYDVAFKLVSVSGCVFLPISAYVFGRLIKMKFPGPQMLAIATVPYLFDRYWTIYGGNIASTLAGEFCFEISLCFALLFIGVFAKSLETGKYRWLAALLLAATLFSHLLPTFFALTGAVLVWLLQIRRRPASSVPVPGESWARDHLAPRFDPVVGAAVAVISWARRQRLGVALVIGVVGLAVAGFWLIPFAMRLGYSNDMGWTRTTAFAKGLFPWMCDSRKTDPNVNCIAFQSVRPYTQHLKIVAALAAAGVLGGIFLRRRSTLLIAGLGLASAAAFRLMPQGTLWNARMLPFWYLSMYLAAAACLSESALAIGILFGRSPHPPAGAFDDGPWLDDETFEPLHERELVGASVGGGGGFGEGSYPGSGGGGAAPGATIGGAGDDPWSSVDAPPWQTPGGPPPSGEPGRDGASRPTGAEMGERHGSDAVAAGGGDPWGPAPIHPWAGAAEGGGELWRSRGNRDGEDLVPSLWPSLVAPVLLLLLVLAFVGQALPDTPVGTLTRFVLAGHYIGGAEQKANPNFVTGWANWNYSGYQEKSAYPEYTDVMSTMNRVGTQYGCGRALWEYESEEDRFGTPMALMLLPMFTNGCIDSEEGLFFESSSTVPYHFLDQAELSERPSEAMVGLPYRSFDVVDGIAHLRLLGVKYYMAITPAAQAAAHTLTLGPDPQLTLVATTGSHEVLYSTGATSTNEARTWQVFEVNDSATVAPLSYEPAVLTHAATTGAGWNKLSVPWYQDQARWAVPLAASGPSWWPRVKASADATPPRIPVHQAVVSGIVNTDDSISFNVDAETVKTRSPVLVKTSYFPNWQATGADGPWRVTPNLMVVIPTSTHVLLHYGYTPVDNAGRLASVAGLAAVGAMWWWDRRLDPIDGESTTIAVRDPEPATHGPAEWLERGNDDGPDGLPGAPVAPEAPSPSPAAAGPWADDSGQSPRR